MSLPQRVAPPHDGDLVAVTEVRPGMYDIGMYRDLPFPIQLSERVMSYPEHNPSYACRWDNDKIIGALNLTEPETCEK